MTDMHNDTKNVRWTGFSASIPGGGHIRRGIPCQDASAVMTSPRPAAIVCDGRGSAKLSHFGAQEAVNAFRFQMSVLDPFLVNILDGEEEKTEQWVKFCRIMYRTLMQVKYDLAEKHNEAEKEFDCTVAFAIAGEKHIGCFQVGDGSIVLRQNGVCKTVFLPEKGEFANQTHFLRPGGEEQMKFQYALLDATVNSGIAITSDGPEHLMFRLADMTPGKIFDMFLEDLRKEELCKQDLMDYLTRREWADDPRGSDDRSLAVLARIGYEPAILPEKLEPETNSVPVVEVAADNPEIEPDRESAQEKTELAPKAVSETAPEKLEPAPEVESESAQEKTELAPKAVSETAQEKLDPAPEAESETELPAEVQTAPPDVKKKGVPYWTLAIVSGLALGLLAETEILLKQRQTIFQQKGEILYLRQELAYRMQAEQALPEPTLPQPNQPVAPDTKELDPESTPAQPSQPVVPAEKETDPEPTPVQPSQPVIPTGKDEEPKPIQPQTSQPVTSDKKGLSVVPGMERKHSPDDSEKLENENIHEEDIPDEM